MTTILYSHKLKQYLPDGPYGPAYGGESVGLDLYAVEDRTIIPCEPQWGGAFWQHDEHRKASLIPTGIHIVLDHDHVGLIMERGSVTKTPLKVRAGVIDPGFTGEIFVNCVNLDARPYDIKAGMKLPFQLVVTPVVRPTTTLVDDIDAELSKIKSSRGAGQVGSSNLGRI